MMKNFDKTTSNDIGSPENIRLKIVKGQHWIEDHTEIRYTVIDDPTDIDEIQLQALGRHTTASKTVSLEELLDGFSRSFGTFP